MGMGTDPNEYTLESDSGRTQTADANEYRSGMSSVNGKSICARIGMGPFTCVLE